MKEELANERTRFVDSRIAKFKDERKVLTVIMLGCLMASLLEAAQPGDYK